MYTKVIVKARDHDGDRFCPLESLGLRYLIQSGPEIESETENVSRGDSNVKVRRICVSNLVMAITPAPKGTGPTKNDRVKDIDRVAQRPRAILSSPENDDLIGKMNEKASKRHSTPKTATLRSNMTRVDVDNARIRVRGTSVTSDIQNRHKMKDHTRPFVLKDKPCITKLKL
uniref:uncharacterized protein LOC122608503 isoform X2 n=1 Tax=Erigeron canadensis TaxID=72917 RepID=UPI001CB94374|nr:uncharacterized protein LOC122608503 isoform X2 [Erigeron canadensis]